MSITREGKETAEYMQLESFFGLMRKDGMCCVSATRKPLLDARLNVGEGFKKGDVVVLDQNAFRSTLVKYLQDLGLDACLHIRNRLMQFISTPALSQGVYSLSWNVLLIWISDTGVRRFKIFRDMKKKDGFRLFPKMEANIVSMKSAFSDRVSASWFVFLFFFCFFFC